MIAIPIQKARNLSFVTTNSAFMLRAEVTLGILEFIPKIGGGLLCMENKEVKIRPDIGEVHLQVHVINLCTPTPLVHLINIMKLN